MDKTLPQPPITYHGHSLHKQLTPPTPTSTPPYKTRSRKSIAHCFEAMDLNPFGFKSGPTLTYLMIQDKGENPASEALCECQVLSAGEE